jgi:hypothetical protein
MGKLMTEVRSEDWINGDGMWLAGWVDGQKSIAVYTARTRLGHERLEKHKSVNSISCNFSQMLIISISIGCHKVTKERVHPEKLSCILSQKFPALYGTRRFITVSTRARHWTLSWAKWIQSTVSHSNSLISTLILSSHLYLDCPSGLFPFGFPTQTP